MKLPERHNELLDKRVQVFLHDGRNSLGRYVGVISLFEGKRFIGVEDERSATLDLIPLNKVRCISLFPTEGTETLPGKPR